MRSNSPTKKPYLIDKEWENIYKFLYSSQCSMMLDCAKFRKHKQKYPEYSFSLNESG